MSLLPALLVKGVVTNPEKLLETVELGELTLLMLYLAF
jgi:hypothetical protein